MQLPIDGPALFVIERQLALHDEAVNLRIGVGAEVFFHEPISAE